MFGFLSGALHWPGHEPMSGNMLTNSLGQKTFTCPICKYSSTYSTNFKRHMRRHTGQLFRCEACGLAYNCRYYLQKHILRMHGSDQPVSDREYGSMPEFVPGSELDAPNFIVETKSEAMMDVPVRSVL